MVLAVTSDLLSQRMVFCKAQGLHSHSLGPHREQAGKLEAEVLSVQEQNATLKKKLAHSGSTKAEVLKL